MSTENTTAPEQPAIPPLPGPSGYADPTDDPEYHKWVESVAKYCRCSAPWPCPCDGVLTGGMCDDLGNEPDFTLDDLEWSEEYE